MRNLYLLFACFVLGSSFSCEPEIESNSRGQAKGRLVDQNAIGVAGILVRAETPYTRLGFQNTDAEGNFEFTYLIPGWEIPEVQLNPRDENPDYNSSFASISYVDNSSMFTTTNSDYGDVMLPELATFELTLKANANTQDTLNFRVTYADRFCERYRFPPEDDVEIEELCFVDTEFFGQHLPDDLNKTFDFATIQGRPVYIDFRINSGAEQNLVLNLNNSILSYEITH
ncbi:MULTISPECIES: hypothetical protein [unclassified Leeuwenhoekiella]|uniref:hypothetical protein n=1 Tax=unclassified Leeuwenhoekiella TaxID=2615029 RepID=UPI000C4CE74D|nr:MULTISPECIES: hypothetical protein [unclassified Leeuwenhoekiella]MAW96046.1 hypothetical protein [Leeuwenhoekiella sp.]MBA80040.1 hypothetical protein [Leeuwenhoekiella sp.]|tara:strand:+ start:40858 stop:41541 length:684 start_codon:yes stop_codon:yes gene_type:complete